MVDQVNRVLLASTFHHSIADQQRTSNQVPYESQPQSKHRTKELAQGLDESMTLSMGNEEVGVQAASFGHMGVSLSKRWIQLDPVLAVWRPTAAETMREVQRQDTTRQRVDGRRWQRQGRGDSWGHRRRSGRLQQDCMLHAPKRRRISKDKVQVVCPAHFSSA
jgi:hypothetical protein